MSVTAMVNPPTSHPGLDPGSMNTLLRGLSQSVFMGPGVRRDDFELAQA
jgi:hypothetical protein